ncbi:MAG: hypothetical protein WBC59_07330 [Phycisphaerae bacterium]
MDNYEAPRNLNGEIVKASRRAWGLRYAVERVVALVARLRVAWQEGASVRSGLTVGPDTV